MTKTEILERVRSTMAEMFELDPGAITPEARLIEDLDLDSIDAIDMAVKMQEITGKRVEEAELRKLRTIGDIVNLLGAMLATEG